MYQFDRNESSYGARHLFIEFQLTNQNKGRERGRGGERGGGREGGEGRGREGGQTLIE